ncbi:MAG: hypothetical protein QXP36_13680 [Conexivisphaerales archaeon]
MTPLKCTLFSKFNREEKTDIFFSTTWCRDRLFTSENPNDILKFYDTFSNRDELIQWMKERPKGRAEIIEVEGDREIIVVIPTADFNGKYAKECRENIFKGLHMIFVESGFPKDPYFNYAHSCNVGIKKAIEYNPKWIVISNDDMIKRDDVEKLINELSKLSHTKVNVVFTNPTKYHSAPGYVAKLNLLSSVAIKIVGFISTRISYISKVYSAAKRLNSNIFLTRIIFGAGLQSKIANLLLLKNRTYFVNIGSFGIFSSKFIYDNLGSLYDEIYVNDREDIDLSIRIKNLSYSFINYKIDEYIGQTLGAGSIRIIRTLPSLTYFSYKVDMGIIILK